MMLFSSKYYSLVLVNINVLFEFFTLQAVQLAKALELFNSSVNYPDNDAMMAMKSLLQEALANNATTNSSSSDGSAAPTHAEDANISAKDSSSNIVGSGSSQSRNTNTAIHRAKKVKYPQ